MADQQHTSWWRRAGNYLLDVYHAYMGDRAPLAAAAIAFFVLLSMVPLLLFLISIASFFISPAQVQSVVTDLTEAFGPGIGGAFQSEILSVVQNRGLLTGLSLVFGLWAGSQIFVMIEEALNQVWDVEGGRSFWWRRGMALLMVFVTGILLMLAIGVYALVQVALRAQIPVLDQLERITGFSLILGVIIPALLASLAFALIYKYLSARKVTWSLVLPGAVLTGFLWAVALQIFSWYTANVANYSVLYGSLAGYILIMLWVNYSAQILLLGAEITAVTHQRKVQAGKIRAESWEEERQK